MVDVANLVRPNIRALQPYTTARDEYTADDGIFLDANENPYGTLNRYPDPHQTDLKLVLSQLKNIPTENIFTGNGSDEVIDLALRIFCTPGHDKVIICPPTYGMYEVAAHIHDVEVIKIPLTNDFQLNIDKILQTDAKLLFLCSPNNPTGNHVKNIQFILDHFAGIVFVDEAYIDFSLYPTLVNLIHTYPNLIVSQTLSKAWGLAAARIGMAFSCKETILFFDKTKPPYNISTLNQRAALDALQHEDLYKENVQKILASKNSLGIELLKISAVTNIYPSDANFLLVEMNHADKIYDHLIEQNIIIRNRSTVVQNCLRITVGTEKENQLLLNALKMITR